MDGTVIVLRVFAVVFVVCAFILLTFAFQDLPNFAAKFMCAVVIGWVSAWFWIGANRRQAAAEKARKEMER